MYSSPFGATARFVGRLTGGPPRAIDVTVLPSYPVSDARPLVPSVRRRLPSGSNLRAVWSPSLTHHTEPSGATVMPCARIVNSPSPHERTNLPSRSYTSTGCSARQKRYTRPLASTATAATSGCEKPAGSCSQPSTTSYTVGNLQCGDDNAGGPLP